MELLFLGCGTSTGVPIVGCKCEVCQSEDKKNKRFRSSVLVTLDSGHTILIDTSPDLRTQGIDNNLTHIDSVLYTHIHADHIHGIDELRTYNFLQKSSIDVYGYKEHLDHIQHRFSYIFEDSIQKGGGKPLVDLNYIDPGKTFILYDAEITPIKCWHGKLVVMGYRINNLVYLTDINRIPEESWSLLENVDVLVLDALRYTPHSTHFSVDEAVEVAQKINARECYLTHMGHEIEYNKLLEYLPEGIQPAYDYLRVNVLK